ncbi:MAG: DUF3526 domain-containing protein [Planctomycetota bacterium]
MIRALFINEWLGLLRDGRALLLLALGALLAVVSAWTAGSTDARERAGQAAAAERARAAWVEREADNPHSRAHYGDYVFRPSGPLAGLDSGLQMVTGRAVFTEAHRQNAAVHRPQGEAATLLRFDRLEPSNVLQLLVPLVLVLAGFGSVASDRESGRLRLLAIQGVRPLPLLLAKALTLWSLGAVLCFLVVGTHLASAGAVAPLRTLAYLGLHLATLWIVALVVTCASAWLRRPGTAAAVLLLLWGGAAIVLPRLAAMTANALDPLPGRDAFEAAMREDREQGLDGHNPRDERRLALEQQVLDEYGVGSKDELPINLDGLMMQADEDYGNSVWDKHFGSLEEHLLRQSAVTGAFTLANPLHATDRLSMAIAGTGLSGHLAFLRQTESYRRALVKSLNDEHAHGGSRTGEWSWKADADFYAAFDSFQYEPPALGALLGRCSLELVGLAGWFVGLTGLLVASARRLERGGSL